MAQFVLGIGSSHGPTMSLPWEDWVEFGKKDSKDQRIDQSALSVKPELEKELTPDVLKARSEAIHAGIAQLAARIADAAPDTFLVVSNPHRIYPEEPQPIFGIYLGETMPVTQDPHAGGGQKHFNSGADLPPRQCPSDPALAAHVMNSLVMEGFDIACTDRFRAGTMLEHAYAVMYEHYFTDPMPLVPFVISRYLPNQATPARCYALGQAIRDAIESWDSDRRVAVVASGGLSHQVLDEALDREAIAALCAGDRARIERLPRARLNGGPGTPEILNWVALAGVASGVPMTLIDYVPCYRSLLGTGHGVAFGCWTP